MEIITKIKFKKAAIISLACGAIGLYFGLLEIIFQHLQVIPYNHTPWTSLIMQISGGLISGMGLGLIEMFVLRQYFRKKSFGFAILIETIIFVSVFTIMTIVVSTLYHLYQTQSSLFSDTVINGVHNYLFSLGFVLNFINWSLSFIFILFVIQVSDKFGQGVLLKFITGKYHLPKEENRIFMFLDLDCSTQIGEKLGHIQYHSFLNDFFSDVTDPIVESGGEIYQYVGDEISATWKVGSHKDNYNCIKCFLEIQEQINCKSDFYLNKYDLLPKFKAGINCGKVTAGEVGIIKKEIIFAGDVLNTTSRIMNSNKQYETNLLFSEELLSLMTLPENVKSTFVDTVKLRGKEKEISLFTLL